MDKLIVLFAFILTVVVMGVALDFIHDLRINCRFCLLIPAWVGIVVIIFNALEDWVK